MTGKPLFLYHVATDQRWSGGVGDRGLQKGKKGVAEKEVQTGEEKVPANGSWRIQGKARIKQKHFNEG